MSENVDRQDSCAFLSETVRQHLASHQVMSVAQQHQLARQIRLCRRIRERTKHLQAQKPFGFRASNIQPSWGVDLSLSNLVSSADADKPVAKARKPKKQAQAPKPRQPSKATKKQRKAEQEAEEEEEEEAEAEDSPDSEDSDEEADGASADARNTASRDRKLRPRKEVSFNLEQLAAAQEGSEEAVEEIDSEVEQPGSGQTSRSGSRSGGRSGGKRKRAESLEVMDDEDSGPAQLVEMQPVHLEWDNVVCGVCGDDEHAEGNELVLCDGKGCDVAAHQQCYGMARVPRGKWHCDACSSKLDLSKANCVCCPVLGGVLRKVKTCGEVKLAPSYHNKQPYLHLACALWTPEIIITDPDNMRAPSLEGLRQHRVELTCAICKQAGGAVIQCSFGVCTRAFHVLCGRHVEAAAAFRHSDGHPLAFCVQHSKERYQKTRDKLIAGDDVLSQEMDTEDMPGTPVGPSEPNDYEVQRQQNIERNRQLLASL